MSTTQQKMLPLPGMTSTVTPGGIFANAAGVVVPKPRTVRRKGIAELGEPPGLAWWVTGWPGAPASDAGPYDTKAEADDARDRAKRHIAEQRKGPRALWKLVTSEPYPTGDRRREYEAKWRTNRDQLSQVVVRDPQRHAAGAGTAGDWAAAGLRGDASGPGDRLDAAADQAPH